MFKFCISPDSSEVCCGRDNKDVEILRLISFARLSHIAMVGGM